MLREESFAKFLTQEDSINSKDRAVRSRISKAKKIEDTFEVILDQIVKDDEAMYTTLKQIKEELNDHLGNIQNALRKYYIFVNNVEFLTFMRDYMESRNMVIT